MGLDLTVTNTTVHHLHRQKTAGMASPPPVELHIPPDRNKNIAEEASTFNPAKSTLNLQKNTDKAVAISSNAGLIRVATSQNQTHSSSNLQNTPANTVALSEEQIAWVHRIISLEKSRLIRVESNTGDESPLPNLHNIKFSENFTMPNACPPQANEEKTFTAPPEIRSQIRPTSGEFRAALTTGVCSPLQGAPTTKVSDQMAGEIIQEQISGEVAGAPAKFSDQLQSQNGRFNELNNPQQVSSLESKSNNSNIQNNATGDSEVQNNVEKSRNPNSDNSRGTRLVEMQNVEYPIHSTVPLSCNLELAKENLDSDSKEAAGISCASLTFGLGNNETQLHVQTNNNNQEYCVNEVELGQTHKRMDKATHSRVATVNSALAQQQHQNAEKHNHHNGDKNAGQAYMLQEKHTAGICSDEVYWNGFPLML
ncbi:uncharacterized protein LOC129874124 [Solanum dulcamara]|uniref:uncharacterized protein LOC129874124 n=1 Tax=Solanum dulcamara TaxID=45834 RepID=UPI0024865267|nr:uncharacterized protein LOC129874124 [Solanum dulcamara]XP_055805326.1 uncharacterized protein LOC129874124 [Solanum dulcamara]XP_055805328.1 uncharacterized protein LOC129874124 [Solanum dulcamara]XP_055805329.1 uncharacterized protein LOC129874124 [Solanum dulcamara]XP_055805330.1 uncharacterized protein LOC129874124 [Solanum dulcamara]XP_055805331.1 uncharacterized protein LOC129874124 [Solanum dulcamara]XP_055805332.1 uncharacterized protein LOC129874124 [Solanum dulcamara]XP_05580533